MASGVSLVSENHGARFAIRKTNATSLVYFGFGILLLFITFEFGAMAFAEPILRALAWPAVLVGNLLGAGAMAVYFWRHHPKLRIAP